MSTFSIQEAVSHGWQKTKERFWFVVSVTFVNLLVNSFSQFGKKRVDGKIDYSFPLSIISIIIWVIGVIISIGVLKIFLKLERGEHAEFSDIYRHARLFWKYVFSHFIIVIVIIIGFILLIVPGFIFALRYSMVPWLVVDKELWPFPALKQSSRITYGHKWQLFKFFIVLIGINILGFIVLGVGLLVSVPVSMFAFVHVYNKLQTIANPVLPPIPPPAPAVSLT